MSSASYLTVKALTKYIKRKFDADPHLREVYVKGELIDPYYKETLLNGWDEIALTFKYEDHIAAYEAKRVAY